MHQFCTHSDTPSKQNLEVIGGATTILMLKKDDQQRKKKLGRGKPAVHFKSQTDAVICTDTNPGLPRSQIVTQRGLRTT